MVINRADRAKQFMPFDALKGFKEALKKKEEELEYVEKKELSEEFLEELSEKLKCVEIEDYIEIKYYSNQMYNYIKGVVKRIDKIEKKIHIEEKKINFIDIIEIKRI